MTLNEFVTWMGDRGGTIEFTSEPVYGHRMIAHIGPIDTRYGIQISVPVTTHRDDIEVDATVSAWPSWTAKELSDTDIISALLEWGSTVVEKVETLER